MATSSQLPATPFDGPAGELFATHNLEVRGYVRYELARRYLEPYLPPVGSRALDFGGGIGEDALWLHGLGYDVTLLDESEKYIAAAKARAIDLEGGHTRFNTQVGHHDQLAGQSEAYDLVLSHGVLMYSDKPAEQLAAIAAVLKTGATLSLLTKGLMGALIQAEREHRQDNVFSLKESGTYLNRLGVRAHAYARPIIRDMLTTVGFEVLEWNGVRTQYSTQIDHRKIWEINPDTLDQIIYEEYEAGHSGYKKALAPMLHFIARKA